MSTKAGEYDHLGETVELNVRVAKMTTNFDDLADDIVRMNYGTHRFLSALIRARKRSAKHTRPRYPDELVHALQEMLKNGIY